ncbi:four helix bundle protein [Luteimonas sp. JM171]|uniref:four helix bundle protein n=1 Tax=Luteimonas sp. JM171 TaxID=1896164 RepID=UPI00085524AB|nr:four helix bundle protein [Luteimonas sp. JM171]AOH36852.1 hypothetical protein BGP89_11225 [Luteimonas sp. JM171]
MASRYQPPPIIKACERLLVDIEQAVRRFPRYHRYQVGADLRQQARRTYNAANRAWRERDRTRYWVARLVWQVDELKQEIQTAKLLRAFGSFRQFEHLARQADALGAQAGGWHRQQQHPKAQSAQARSGVVQRGQKLSTRAAPEGAKS